MQISLFKSLVLWLIGLGEGLCCAINSWVTTEIQQVQLPITESPLGLGIVWSVEFLPSMSLFLCIIKRFAFSKNATSDQCSLLGEKTHPLVLSSKCIAQSYAHLPRSKSSWTQWDFWVNMHRTGLCDKQHKLFQRWTARLYPRAVKTKSSLSFYRNRIQSPIMELLDQNKALDKNSEAKQDLCC